MQIKLVFDACKFIPVSAQNDSTYEPAPAEREEAGTGRCTCADRFDRWIDLLVRRDRNDLVPQPAAAEAQDQLGLNQKAALGEIQCIRLIRAGLDDADIHAMPNV